MADELVHYVVDRGVATITLDSPSNRNALSSQLRAELKQHLTSAIDDNAVRVIVLDHTGPVFCAGMDLKEARGSGAGDQGVNEFPQLLTQIMTSPKPVVAKLAGPARAGGVGIVAAADIAVAVEDATFAFSEVRIGVVPAVISIPVLPRLLPRAAHELFLTGEQFTAKRAADIGLINSAVPADALDDEVGRFVKALVAGGPQAVAATKELLRGDVTADDLAKSFNDMLSLSARFFASEEGQEGITAFAQKRKPNWIPES
ncbi:enoyl-CoA hydratase family protein [Haloechinothrix halophila]|uniref:enoyl-CoA hydratase family protein n=1 Tax=Haloechinothrix halophila TaxID=1069073 RepID=UPI0005533933|nr:enoyl-CoA hydratase family protein [Haloechinothrix halophila]